MSQASKTPLLDRVKTPQDLRGLPEKDLRQLADELRQETIDAVSVTGGHLGAGLGVVELTVALHRIFDTPRDRLVWDVGHQAYPHKILTSRRDRIRTLRQGGGLSGFTKRAESEYDTFGAAHSSTSISAGLGMAVALLSLGTRLGECLKAADQLAALGLPATVADARFAKPFDTELVRRLVANHEVLITIEEGSSGGFGALVLHYLAAEGLLDSGLKVRTMMLPDTFIDHDKPEKMYDVAGLNARHIVATLLATLGRDARGFEVAERA